MNNMNIGIAEISTYVPDNMVSKEFPTDMAIKCSQDLIERSNIKSEDIDMIVYASSSLPEYFYWADYAKIQHHIGAVNAGTFKIDQSKNSLLVGIDYAWNKLKSDENAENVLVISADAYCTMNDRKDTFNDCTMKDGAGAVLIKRNIGKGKICSFKSKTISKYSNIFTFPRNGLRNLYNNLENFEELNFKYDLETINLGESSIEEYLVALENGYVHIVNELISEASMKIADIDCIIVANRNENYVKNLCDSIDFDISKTSWQKCKDLGHFGSSDLVINLDKMLNEGVIKDNDTVMLITHGFGASITGMIIKY